MYKVDEDVVSVMIRDAGTVDGPDGGFTQRSTFDSESDEIILLSGLMRERNSSTETAKNSIWCFNLKNQKWTRVYHNENVDAEYWIKNKDLEPCPRYAHQFLFDSQAKVHYLYGGNPGEAGHPRQRLDDLWELKLKRPSCSDIKRKLMFLIRKQCFFELCQLHRSSEPVQALKYLQTKVYEVVNHEEEEESKNFRLLTGQLFVAGKESVLSKREFYEELVEFFPTKMKPPKSTIISLIM